MTALVYGVLGLLVTVIRSTMALHLGAMDGHLFDLNIPLIVALGLSGTFKERLPAALFIGFWADCLSVASFGFYITFYGWLFVSIRVLGLMIQIDNAFVIWLVLIAGVLLEYLSGVIFVQQFSQYIQLTELFWQLVWVSILGTVLIVVTRYYEEIVRQLIKKIAPVE